MIDSLSALELALAQQSGVLFLVDVEPQVYRASAPISQSDLKSISSHSPEHFRYFKGAVRKDTAALKLGRAYHVALLEPEKYEQLYRPITKVDRRTGKGKDMMKEAEAEAAAEGRELLMEEDYYAPLKLASHMARTQPGVYDLLSNGLAEKSCYGHIEGTPAKARPDLYSPGKHRIIDLKSAESASPAQFERSIRKYRYHWQAAWYTDLIHSITGEVPEFFIVACEKSEPWGSAVFRIRFDLLAIARKEIREALAVYRRCVAEDRWPGYTEMPQEIGAYDWEWKAYKKDLHERNMGA